MADAHPLTKHDAHPFEARRDAPDRCAVCGEHPRHILHHPTRVRAARALRGLPAGPRTRGA
jgi:hypothetical protein